MYKIVFVSLSMCVAGRGHAESASHLFLYCDIFGSLWQYGRSWFGVSGVEPHSIRDHFLQFTYYLGGSKARRLFLQLLWLLCIWLVWNERNNRLFNNIQTPIIDLMKKVKYNSYWWLNAHNATCIWLSEMVVGPIVMLGYRLTVFFVPI